MRISSTTLWLPDLQVASNIGSTRQDTGFQLDEFLTDTVNFSSLAKASTGVTSNHDVNQLCNPLSDSDKRLFKELTGWDMDAQPEGPAPPLSQGERNFMMIVSLDRASGNLTGDVTPEYISNLILKQMRDPSGQTLVPNALLEKALSIVSK